MNGKLLFSKRTNQFIATIFVLFASVSLVNAQGNFKVFNFTSTGALRTTATTSDGGMVLGCFGITTLPSVPASFVKIDQQGDVVWSKRIYETNTTYYPGGHAKIVGTNDGGMFIIGNDLKKTDAQGDIQWSLILPVSTIIEMQDQNYLAMAYTIAPDNNDLIELTKISTSGIVLWKKTISTYGCYAENIIELDSDNFILSGSQFLQPSNSSKMIFTSVNISTNMINWSKAYQATGNIKVGATIAFKTDSAIVCVGEASNITNYDADQFMMKLDFQGNIIWSKTNGGANDDRLNGAILAQDGGYIFAGSTESYGAGYSDVYCFKLSSNGDLIWNRNLGGEGIDGTAAIMRTAGDSFMLVGGTQSIQCIPYIFIVNLDETNSNCWDASSGQNFQDISLALDTANISIIDDLFTQPVADTVNSDTIIVSISEQCPVMCSSIGLADLGSNSTFTVSPNPATEFMSIGGRTTGNSVFAITNVMGQEVLEGKLSEGNKTIDIHSLETGIYLLKVQNGAQISIHKFIKE